jgi:SNF2 family DNA or RNA helicase
MSIVPKFSRPLWKHQEKDILRFASEQQAALLWDVGTGKTKTAIGLARVKYNTASSIISTLILTKTGVCWNWARAIEENSPPAVYEKVCVLYGKGKTKLSGDKRKEMLRDPKKSIFIVNWEALRIKDFNKALKARGFKIIIADESQTIKNYKSEQFKKLLTFSDSAVFKMILTGTPISATNLMDIWAQYRFLDGGRLLGTNFYAHFRNKYFIDKNAGMPKAVYFPAWEPIPGSENEIMEKIALYASRIDADSCLDLPPIITKKEPVELGTDQQKAYDEMYNNLVTYVKTKEATASNALVGVMRLMQIISGHLKLDDGTIVRFKDNPRKDRLKEVLEMLTPKHKVVVWATFTETYRDIEDICNELGIGFCALTGETKDKQGQIDLFVNDASKRVMYGNPKAGGVGVDGLQHATNYSIRYTRDYSLESKTQSDGRTRRGGSEKFSNIIKIEFEAIETLDSEVLAAVESKEDFSKNILERLKNA